MTTHTDETAKDILSPLRRIDTIKSEVICDLVVTACRYLPHLPPKLRAEMLRELEQHQTKLAECLAIGKEAAQ